jgi:S-adenosylmethionine-diacylglycerol 3-amino-3-carboxypropyl transferase
MDLEREEFVGFLGFDGSMSPERRRALFERLTLSGGARRYLGWLFEANRFGPIVYMGRFERMLGQLAAVSALYAGRGARNILEMTTLDEQRSYYHATFPKRRWKQIVFLMGNSAVLNALLYRGEFPKKNLPESAYTIYTRIFERLFTRMLARSSFFLQMVLLGSLRFPEGWPAECDPGTYAAAREALRQTRIELVHGDVFDALASGDAPADLVALSDVPSFLPPGRDRGFLQAIQRGVRTGGRVITRGHLRVPEPAADGYDDVSGAHAALLESERTQLWQIHVYART